MTTTTWFTSDTHYGHKNIIKYSNRPFDSVEEMDEALITNYNAVVKPGDTLYHLGDFAFAETSRVCNILRRLNGNKHFIRGNHDKSVQGDALGYFSFVKDYHELKIKTPVRQKIVLCHYPFETWNAGHHGTWHLHGHTHRNLKTSKNIRRWDVGVDSNNYFPVSFEQIAEIMKNKSDVEHHLDV